MLGSLLQWLINCWIIVSGKRLKKADHPWLDGPISDDAIIGDEFYKTYAESHNLTTKKTSDGGLIENFGELVQGQETKLNGRIATFYENTASYKLEVWSQWSGPIQLFAKTLIKLLSRKMQQLNIPLNPLESSYGMSSEVIALITQDGHQQSACWLRKSVKSNSVVYAGFYSSCQLPKYEGRFVRVVFPLPAGNVTVILKPIVQTDGSIKLISAGNRIGEPGYYRIRKSGKKHIKVKYIPLKEIIHVFEDQEGTLRTNHEFYFWRSKFLELHYKIMDT